MPYPPDCSVSCAGGKIDPSLPGYGRNPVELFFTPAWADGGWAIYPPAQLEQVFLVSKNKRGWGLPCATINPRF